MWGRPFLSYSGLAPLLRTYLRASMVRRCHVILPIYQYMGEFLLLFLLMGAFFALFSLFMGVFSSMWGGGAFCLYEVTWGEGAFLGLPPYENFCERPCPYRYHIIMGALSQERGGRGVARVGAHLQFCFDECILDAI